MYMSDPPSWKIIYASTLFAVTFPDRLPTLESMPSGVYCCPSIVSTIFWRSKVPALVFGAKSK